jgi:preprotein translocase subunit YajC
LRRRREKRRTELIQQAKALREQAELLTAGGRTGEVHVRSETQNRFGTIESMLNRAGQFETVASRLADLLGIEPGA